MINNVKGWIYDEYTFDELYDSWHSVMFEYNGHKYRISCEGDKNLYDESNGEVIRHFESKEDFYSSIIFGRPIKEVIDDSYMLLYMY